MENEPGSPPQGSFGASDGASVPEGTACLALLAQIVENSPIPIFLKDPHGTYLYVNAAYADMDAAPVIEIVGRTDSELYTDEIADALRKDDLLAMMAPGPVESTQPFEVDGGERRFRIVKFPIHSDSGEILGVCGMALDITDTLLEEKSREAERKHRIAALPFERLLASLTPQEARVAELLLIGLSDKEIAEALHVTEDTVRHHVSHLLKKLRKSSRTQAVIALMRSRKPS